MKRLAKGDAVLLISLRRSNPIRGCVEVNLGPLLVLALENPCRAKAELRNRWIPFQSGLKIRCRLIVDRHPMTRTLLFGVGETIGDHPLLVEAPRTEELPFAGSSRSRWDRNLGHCGRCERESREKEQPFQIKNHRSLVGPPGFEPGTKRL